MKRAVLLLATVVSGTPALAADPSEKEAPRQNAMITYYPEGRPPVWRR